MKKINKKGFVMAETIIVSVFVMAIVSFLIMNALPLIGEYERIANYDTLESKYNANLIRKMILMSDEKSDAGERKVYKDVILALGTDFYKIYSMDNFCNKYNDAGGSRVISYMANCKMLLGTYYLNVKNIIITSYSISSLKHDVNDIDVSRAFRDYIKYIPSYENGQFAGVATARRLLVEFSDGTFSNIEVIN